jgi:hypothetical protein
MHEAKWRPVVISFEFTVNQSVLGYPNRPITIPKRLYGRLEQEILRDEDDIVVVCPDGTPMTGYIHSSTAGYGPYYQIRVRRGYPGDPISQLRIGRPITVEIERIRNEVHVKLREP